MPHLSTIEHFLQSKVPLVDVRSPAEFNKAHIPLAINLPLLNNQERVEVGTLYKHKGRKEAVLR